MKNLKKIMLGAGILFLAVGVVGAGLTYRDIRTENLIHAKMATIRIPFQEASISDTDDANGGATVTSGFLPFREGLYTLYLSFPETEPSPGSADGRSATRALLDDLLNYAGSVDVIIIDPEERVPLNLSITGDDVPGLLPGENGWIFIDTLRIPPGEEQWTLSVSVCPAGSSPPAAAMDFFLLPPQQYDIATYMADGIKRVVGFAGLMLAGFIMIVLAGRIGE